MTNETGIERVFYIYNSSGCSCLWPYFHPPLLYTELCEVLWVPKLHRFPNKAGLCPRGTNWGLFHLSTGRTQRERPWALWVWQLLLKLVLEAISVQLHCLTGTGLCIDATDALQPKPHCYGCTLTLFILTVPARGSTSMLSWAALPLPHLTDTPQVPDQSKPFQSSPTDCSVAS